MNEVRNRGYTPVLYSYKNVYENYLHPDPIASSVPGCKIWYAHYTSQMTGYTGRYDIWQYTSKGTCAGIDGYVDLNVVYM